MNGDKMNNNSLIERSVQRDVLLFLFRKEWRKMDGILNKTNKIKQFDKI